MPLSTVDWPGELAAVVFLRGCPWDCPYCHNPHLISGAPDSGDTTWDEVRSFLRTRVGLLDGVVFSGGEPTAQLALAEAIAEVREMGFRVALHTGGPVPERVREVLPSLSWVGFDVKAPFAEYARVTRVDGSGERALESLRSVVRSGIGFEVRTTVHPDLLDADALLRMADELVAEGVTRWIIQPYRPDGARDVLSTERFISSDVPAGIAERFELFEIR